MRVLVATVTAGAGHLQAAAALEEAWRLLCPEDDLERLDVLSYTPKLYRKAYAEGYLHLVATAPELYGLLFNRSDNPALVKKLTRLRRELAKVAAPRLARRLKRSRPDVVLASHFLPLELLGGLRLDPKPFLVSVVTDFEAHALWMEPAVDLYAVAAEETRDRLVARGVDPAKVVVTGIPILAKFSRDVDPGPVRRSLGLRDDLPVILLLAGGFGVGSVDEVLAELDRIAPAVQVIAVAGRNEPLRRRLACRAMRQPTRVLGFVDNLHELLEVADLVVTKPGGLTTSEALAKGKPIVVVNPIPGQEAANADFLLEHGAAVKANRVEDLPAKLERLLAEGALAGLARRARELGRKDAARAVCAETLRRVAEA